MDARLEESISIWKLVAGKPLEEITWEDIHETPEIKTKYVQTY